MQHGGRRKLKLAEYTKMLEEGALIIVDEYKKRVRILPLT